MLVCVLIFALICPISPQIHMLSVCVLIFALICPISPQIHVLSVCVLIFALICPISPQIHVIKPLLPRMRTLLKACSPDEQSGWCLLKTYILCAVISLLVDFC